MLIFFGDYRRLIEHCGCRVEFGIQIGEFAVVLDGQVGCPFLPRILGEPKQRILFELVRRRDFEQPLAGVIRRMVILVPGGGAGQPPQHLGGPFARRRHLKEAGIRCRGVMKVSLVCIGITERNERFPDKQGIHVLGQGESFLEIIDCLGGFPRCCVEARKVNVGALQRRRCLVLCDNLLIVGTCLTGVTHLLLYVRENEKRLRTCVRRRIAVNNPLQLVLGELQVPFLKVNPAQLRAGADDGGTRRILLQNHT